MKITINSKQLLQELESFNLKYKKVAQKYNEGVEAYNILVKEQKVRIEKAYQEWVAPIEEMVSDIGADNIIRECLVWETYHKGVFWDSKAWRFCDKKASEKFPTLTINEFICEIRPPIASGSYVYVVKNRWGDKIAYKRNVEIRPNMCNFDHGEVKLKSRYSTSTEVDGVVKLTQSLLKLNIDQEIILEEEDLKTLTLVRENVSKVQQFLNSQVLEEVLFRGRTGTFPF